jgi:hypothetical protein
MLEKHFPPTKTGGGIWKLCNWLTRHPKPVVAHHNVRSVTSPYVRTTAAKDRHMALGVAHPNAHRCRHTGNALTARKKLPACAYVAHAQCAAYPFQTCQQDEQWWCAQAMQGHTTRQMTALDAAHSKQHAMQYTDSPLATYLAAADCCSGVQVEADTQPNVQMSTKHVHILSCTDADLRCTDAPLHRCSWNGSRRQLEWIKEAPDGSSRQPRPCAAQT